MFKTKFNPGVTAQSKPIPGRAMVKNRGGGYVFSIDKWEALRRFLTIGTMGGTFYAKERELTEEAYLGLIECLKEDGFKAVDMIADVSEKGLALKNDYALYALAVACTGQAGYITDEGVKRRAFNALPRVARTGTHLFQFVAFREQLGGGWGPSMKKAVLNWYNSMPTDKLAYQVTKYQSRKIDGDKGEGPWTHRDLLRLTHPKPANERGRDISATEAVGLAAEQALRLWILDGLKGFEGYEGGKHPMAKARPVVSVDSLPRIVQGFEVAKVAKNAGEVVRAIADYKLTREMIPTQYLSDPEVQEALLEFMPLHALIRNLGNFTKSGLLTPTSAATAKVVTKLADMEYLKKSRVHPFACFVALNTYKSGQGYRGKGSWHAVPRVIDALDQAMYGCVGNIPSSGKGVVVGIDGSGSMSAQVADLNTSVRNAAVAMALFTVKAEPGCQVVGFTHKGVTVPISARQRVDDAIALFERIVDPQNTDCAIPIQMARQFKWRDVAGFVTYTDNETWAGPIHPHQALLAYRKEYGINSKHVAVAMTTTHYSIADDADPRSMNVVGFSADAAKVIGDFLVAE